jgi:hypothetical protein
VLSPFLSRVLTDLALGGRGIKDCVLLERGSLLCVSLLPCLVPPMLFPRLIRCSSVLLGSKLNPAMPLWLNARAPRLLGESGVVAMALELICAGRISKRRGDACTVVPAGSCRLIDAVSRALTTAVDDDDCCCCTLSVPLFIAFPAVGACGLGGVAG